MAEPEAPVLVGRAREVASLQRALAGAGAPVILVEGEAGVGKSRLVREQLTGAGAGAGAGRTVRAACPPHPEPLMLAPVVAALRSAVPVTGLAGRPGRLSGLAGALRPLFPEWAGELPPPPELLTDPGAARHRLFRALAELLAHLDVAVLVVEDVHWADPVTLELLLFLASRPGAAYRPSLVVTYRPEEVPADSLLLRLPSRLPAGSRHRIALSPLDRADTARLVSSMLGGEPVAEPFAAFLHRRTGGLPLAVEESVRLLRARGDLVRRDGRWDRGEPDERRVPPTVRDAVLARVGRLDPPVRRILAAAAVLAEVADEQVVAAVAGLTGEPARAALGAAVASGMLREEQPGRVGLRHELMGQAVYEAIPAAVRARRHLRAGTALEAVTPAPLAQLTRHFRAAGQVGKWTRYAELAADWASGSGDHDAAMVRLNDILTTAGEAVPVRTRARVAGKLAVAAGLRSAVVDARHHQVVDTLRALLDTARLAPREEAEIRSGLGRLLGQLGAFEAARAELERAVRHLDHDPAAAVRAMRQLGLPFTGQDPAPVHRRWLQRAAELDAGRLPPAERVALTVDRAAGLLQLGDEAGWTVAAELPTTAATVEERRQIARGYHNIGSGAILWGRYRHARELLTAAIELADADGYLRIRPQIQISQAQLDWYTGDWEGFTERVVAVADPDRDEPLSVLGAVRMGLWHLAQGTYRKAEAYLEAALAQVRRLGTVDDELEPAAALGRVRLLEDRATDALRETDAPMRTIATKGIWIWATELAPVRVEAMLATEDLAGAAELVGGYRHGLHGCSAPAGRAALATCEALLAEGRGDQAGAAARFAEAAGAWHRLPRPYQALLARERQARCLFAAGRDEAGVSVLSAAFQALCELGARGDADRVAQQLRRHGVAARRTWRRGRRGYGDQLSPRERDVVRLVATGATNREVAAALSRSPKTVAGQLSSAMRKLGVSSRTELAVRTAQEPDLVGLDEPVR